MSEAGAPSSCQGFSKNTWSRYAATDSTDHESRSRKVLAQRAATWSRSSLRHCRIVPMWVPALEEQLPGHWKGIQNRAHEGSEVEVGYLFNVRPVNESGLTRPHFL